MESKCDQENRQTQRQPSFCAQSAYSMSIWDARKRINRLILIPVVSGRYCPGCAWAEENITWCPRILLVLVPHSSTSLGQKFTIAFSQEHLIWPGLLPTHPSLSIVTGNSAHPNARGCWVDHNQAGWRKEAAGPAVATGDPPHSHLPACQRELGMG